MSGEAGRPPGPDMKSDWNSRALQNPRYYIATASFETEEEFSNSGARDVRHFFSELEHLLQPGVEALDLGCGIGRMDEFVAPEIGRLVGLDVSGEMIAQARNRLGHLPNLEFVEGDGFGLAPIADGSLDLVFSHIVFQHVPREVFAGYLPEISRVLKPGGSFVFQLPEALREVPPDPPGRDTFNLRFYREAGVREQLRDAGFTWGSCKRFSVETEIPIDFLRIHAFRPGA